jgi:hypothetical protein
MTLRGLVWAVALALVVSTALACNRRIEPFDPNEKPQKPDLSKIFPKGAERAARIQPGLPEPPGRGAPPMAQEAAAGGEPITGTVRLAEGLGAPVPDGAVLFLIARRGAAGPPLAVKRIPNPSLPLQFSLGPEDRMIQSMPFVGPISITARIDGDGNAMSREPGDLQGEAPDPVDPGASGVVVEIDQRL